jgi:hypothetical protein
VKPERSAKYLEWIRSLRCVIRYTRNSPCAGQVRPHHVHTGGMAQKCSDFATVPLCDGHHTMGHDAVHRIGRKDFERVHHVDLDVLAARCKAVWDARTGRGQQ